MRFVKLISLLYLTLSIPVIAASPDGLVTLSSPHSANLTMQRLQTLITAKQLEVFGLIDHAAGAQKAGLTLRPNAVLIFGSPKIGTALMQCNPRLGLALPLKIQVWKAADGNVWLAYQDPQQLAVQYQLGDCGAAVIANMRKALQAFTRQATAVETQ